MTEIRDVAGLPVTPYNGTGGWSGTETSRPEHSTTFVRASQPHSTACHQGSG